MTLSSIQVVAQPTLSRPAACRTATLARRLALPSLGVIASLLAGTQQAQAQAVPNLVSACSGVSLPRSAVTDIITPVVGGIVTPTQNSVNSLLNLLLPLNIDAAGLLADAAAGQPITLQVLNRAGTVVGPTDACDVQADSVQLNTEGGISIGGNRITGLGTNGLQAVAGEQGSIAFGNSANTAAAAVNAVAIGTGASATAANGVALGAGSVADRGALAGYAAVGLAGTQNSAGAVSVGAAGALRQITNVAAGTAASDAATVGQVAGVAGTVTALADRAVQYDGADRSVVTLAGATGTRVTNVTAGALTAGSTDAVNGAQLFATNQAVAANTNAIANFSTTIANGGVGPVQYSNPAAPTVPNGGVRTNDLTLVGAAAAPVALHNVAAGVVAAASTDATNGGQLFATNQNVTAAQTTANTALAVSQNSVQYGAGRTEVTFNPGGSSTVLRNVAAGTSATDAVNVAQLSSGINSAVTQANSYTDGRILALDYDLRAARRDAYAGTSGALAAAGLPQAYEAGKGMIAIAGGTYRGQTAVALGLSKAFSDGATVVKLSGMYDSRGSLGASGGVGYQF